MTLAPYWPAALRLDQAAEAKTYSSAESMAAEFNVTMEGLLDYIRRGLVKPPSRYIKGKPEWDKIVRKGNSRPGKVYLAGFGTYVKIGFTSASKIEYRLSEIQTGCPEKLTVFALNDGTCATEATLHRRFSDLRTHGEWFRREGDLAAWIDGGCK